jgi:hypothetical protein
VCAVWTAEKKAFTKPKQQIAGLFCLESDSRAHTRKTLFDPRRPLRSVINICQIAKLLPSPRSSNSVLPATSLMTFLLPDWPEKKCEIYGLSVAASTLEKLFFCSKGRD